MITIVDYGMGNIGSLLKMFARLRVATRVATTPADIAAADKLILPGVGHFAAAMTELRNRDLLGALGEVALQARRPVLGVCLGMQLMSRFSEEGDAEGLGWVPADTVRFRLDPELGLRIPNMGWRSVVPTGPSPLFAGMGAGARFYFVHSYHMVCDDPADAAATARYGIDYVCAVRRGNIFGVQFHPEKSHKYGLALLSAFAGV